MADIDIERKSSMSWLWWLLGLLLLALIAWWLLADDEEEVAVVDPVAAPVVAPPVAPVTPEPVAQGSMCVAEVLAAPANYVGQTLGSCPMRVVEVISDRGFWIEENGQRVLVVLNEGPAGTADVEGAAAEQPEINAGQTVNVTEAVVMDNVANVNGPIEEQTRNAAQGQPWFLVTDAANVNLNTSPAAGVGAP